LWDGDLPQTFSLLTTNGRLLLLIALVPKTAGSVSSALREVFSGLGEDGCALALDAQRPAARGNRLQQARPLRRGELWRDNLDEKRATSG
jgi:hypothetical protein